MDKQFKLLSHDSMTAIAGDMNWRLAATKCKQEVLDIINGACEYWFKQPLVINRYRLVDYHNTMLEHYMENDSDLTTRTELGNAERKILNGESVTIPSGRNTAGGVLVKTECILLYNDFEVVEILPSYRIAYAGKFKANTLGLLEMWHTEVVQP